MLLEQKHQQKPRGHFAATPPIVGHVSLSLEPTNVPGDRRPPAARVLVKEADFVQHCLIVPDAQHAHTHARTARRQQPRVCCRR